MKKTRPGISRGAEKGVREVSQLLAAIGCKLKKVCDNQYQVMAGLEDTGLLVYLGKETTEKRDSHYILAVMTFPIPENDKRFHQGSDHEETGTYPYVKAALTDKRAKMLLYEFISRSIHYFTLSKTLRKWHCYHCYTEGFEVFLADGTVATFDSRCNEFSLVIVGLVKGVQGIVFDDQIGKNVWPICAVCRDHLDQEFGPGNDLPVDKSYFQRLLARWPESGQVMMPIYTF